MDAVSTPPGVPRREERGRVLLAEDDPAVRRAYARVLQAQRHEVTQVGDGHEAARALEVGEFDVVVSDVQMPGIGGLDLLRLIRRRDADVPVILVTGFASVESAAAAVEHGALRYLLKPIDIDDFAAEVRRAIVLGRMARVRRQAADLAGVDRWRLADRVTHEARMARALDQLWMAYQPILSVERRSVVAYEALVRTDEPSLPGPVALLSTAEQLGRIHDLGRRVRAAVAQALASSLPADADAFVNLHPADLHDDALYDPNAPLSRQASRVVLEITERASLSPHNDTAARVASLRALGFRIAIDDLGAGYAGLSWFTQLSPDVVKLDMSLVRDVDRDPLKRKVVGALTALCKDLSTVVVGEGVETPGEREALVELGCDLLQGYHFARPARAPPPASW